MRYLAFLPLIALMAPFGVANAQSATCERTVTADVVVIDQPMMFNRLGAQNVNGMMYALRSDVIDKTTRKPEAVGGRLKPGKVELRPDKRPRPLVLRVRAGDCLEVNLENLLSFGPNPFNANPQVMTINDQVQDRTVGFSPVGMNAVNSISDTSSFVGLNPNSLVTPGQSRTYTYYAPDEGSHLIVSNGATFGGEATGGNISNGLFGTVAVQPRGAKFYRSQVTEEDMRLASIGTTTTGQPMIDYEARYPNRMPWTAEGKAGLPIINMLDERGGKLRLVASDINAVIAGPNPDGSFPASTYPLEAAGKRNPALPNRLEAFREIVSIFNDEAVSKQAFPGWFEDPIFSHTLAGVRDAFMVNMGSAGAGSEVIANRLGVGPMQDCLSCAYEEFFLSSFAVGDPSMLVDVPANAGLEFCSPQPGDPFCERDAAVRASYVKYPDDPGNVSHSYIGDFVKFRNLHAGPKEAHIFHLHNHQWLSNPDDDESNYLDAQGIGPGGAYSYEIAFGGSGNRNQSAGDAIFHCHLYPHFAQGMWALWRNHDVFESGTVLDVSTSEDGFHDKPFALEEGRPAPGARALPDGEILAGVPIPAIVPLPGKALAPMPGRAFVVAVDKNGDGVAESSQASVDRTDTDPELVDVRPVLASLDASDPDNQLNPTGLKNPGYPFWIGSIEGAVGQRATTPPLDMAVNAKSFKDGGWDGGLPRHFLDGYAVGGLTTDVQTRLSFEKHIEKAKAHYVPEYGTDVERAAMSFHATRFHPSAKLGLDGSVSEASFRTNGALPAPGSPFFEPCRDDEGKIFNTGTTGRFFSSVPGGTGNEFTAEYGADNPRVYKAANIQLDVVFNKAGDHFPQQRIISLWEDVKATLNKTRPAEPMVFRMNSYDCANYYHTNLIPEFYLLDDYQVTTPTDIIGQHIHLPKWDLVSADGAANGWNYEDGTLAAEAVVHRIAAINRFVLEEQTGETLLEAEPHPFFGTGPENKYLGARTTIQRWFADPVHNVAGKDRGLGVIFTHDHFGPSTHQQVGLYATLLINPAGSTWKHNETGEDLYTRDDGGPTSWQAAILAGDIDGDGQDDSYREFYLEAQDFAHAYNAGTYVGVDENGQPAPPTQDSFRYAVNPSVRKSAPMPDIVQFVSQCPGGVPRPCPEAISLSDIGTFLINYRNEPVGYRVYDPEKTGPDGKSGTQADGLGGDLGFALQTRTDRAMAELNTRLGNTPYPALTADVRPGDAFTPLLRANAGDLVRVRMQAGGHEHEHSATIHGVKWLEGGGSFGESVNSGWRSSMPIGLSEKATFSTSIFGDVDEAKRESDYLYAWDGSQEGFWTGTWGVLRSYERAQRNLFELPNNPRRVPITIANRGEFNGVCPVDSEVVTYDLTAVTVNSVLKTPFGTSIIPEDDSAGMHEGGPLDPAGGTLRYNTRGVRLSNGERGPLHDPTALLYVPTDDLQKDVSTRLDQRMCSDRLGGTRNLACPVKVANNYAFEPPTLRVAAGQCLEVTIRNRLPEEAPDLASFVTQQTVINRDRSSPEGMTTFNNNLIRPSSHVGMHAMKLEYDISRDDGVNVGINPVQTVAPGATRTYRYYAGDLELEPRAAVGSGAGHYGALFGNRFNLVANPVEYGAITFQPSDLLKQGQKGLFGAITVLPEGSTFVTDPGTSAQATVTMPDGRTFRDFSMIIQKAVGLRYRDGSPVEIIAGEGPGVPEDAHDAGGASINLRTEPLWFRYRYGAGSDFGFGGEEGGDGPGLASISDMYRAYSNDLVGQEPQTPVYLAEPGQEIRLRVTSPAGYARNTVLGIFGHNWTQEPFVTRNFPSDTMAWSETQRFMSSQDSIMPPNAWNIMTEAGGPFEVPGDYLYRDLAAFGNLNGLWGILRVEEDAVPTAKPAP
jgi:manganese oxidase